MTDKDTVLGRWPLAEAENVFSRDDPEGYWTVWNLPRGRTDDDTQPRGLYGVGETEDEAWADAARSLDNREYRPRKRPNA